MQEATILSYTKLSLHLQNPDLDDVWKMGYETGQNSELNDTNPYQVGSVEHEYWSEGWCSGYYSEDPLFEYVTETSIASENEAANDLSLAGQTTGLLKHWFHSLACMVEKLTSLSIGSFLVYEVVVAVS